MGNVAGQAAEAGGEARACCCEMAAAKQAAAARVGRLPVEGRYHRLPHRLDDDYQVEEGELLGTGCSGAVVFARNRQTGTACAVKSFKTAGLDHHERRMLADEVGIYLSMDHPHVARLMAVYESETEIHLVMECLEGGELCDRIQAKKVFQEEEAAEATWQMLLAISYLHSEGVVHRDLKLENFLYEQKGKQFLKLIDFGFSKFFQKSTKMRESCGTIWYIAPEVLDRHYQGGSCDMWSLGVIVFVLLAGYMPFDGKGDGEIIRAIRRGRYSMHEAGWSHVSESARDFVKRLLVQNPSDRMTAQEAMKHPWLAGHSGIGSQEPGRCLEGVSLSIAESDVAGAFLSFARATRFQQACLQMMAWVLPAEERRKYRGAFLDLDKAHIGSLRFPQVNRLLEENCHLSKLDRDAVWRAFEVLDVDTDGELHYSDFLAFMMVFRLRQSDCDAVKDAFRHFDVEGLGYLTEEGLLRMLGEEVPRNDLRCTFSLVDADGDGKIVLEDFVTYTCRSFRPACGALAGPSAPLAPSVGSSGCFARKHIGHLAQMLCSRSSYGAA